MDLEILLKDASQSIDYAGVDNTYEEGSFFCVDTGVGEIIKFPVLDIYRVVELSPWRPEVLANVS